MLQNAGLGDVTGNIHDDVNGLLVIVGGHGQRPATPQEAEFLAFKLTKLIMQNFDLAEERASRLQSYERAANQIIGDLQAPPMAGLAEHDGPWHSENSTITCTVPDMRRFMLSVHSDNDDRQASSAGWIQRHLVRLMEAAQLDAQVSFMPVAHDADHAAPTELVVMINNPAQRDEIYARMRQFLSAAEAHNNFALARDEVLAALNSPPQTHMQSVQRLTTNAPLSRDECDQVQALVTNAFAANLSHVPIPVTGAVQAVYMAATNSLLWQLQDRNPNSSAAFTDAERNEYLREVHGAIVQQLNEPNFSRLGNRDVLADRIAVAVVADTNAMLQSTRGAAR